MKDVRLDSDAPAPFLPAQDATWVTVEGTAPMQDISKEEARSRAIEDAMRKAVKSRC